MQFSQLNYSTGISSLFECMCIHFNPYMYLSGVEWNLIKSTPIHFNIRGFEMNIYVSKQSLKR
jgi:hypothetical protein